jgi:hypothetical protein
MKVHVAEKDAEARARLRMLATAAGATLMSSARGAAVIVAASGAAGVTRASRSGAACVRPEWLYDSIGGCAAAPLHHYAVA